MQRITLTVTLEDAVVTASQSAADPKAFLAAAVAVKLLPLVARGLSNSSAMTAVQAVLPAPVSAAAPFLTAAAALAASDGTAQATAANTQKTNAAASRAVAPSAATVNVTINGQTVAIPQQSSSSTARAAANTANSAAAAMRDVAVTATRVSAAAALNAARPGPARTVGPAPAGGAAATH